MGVMRFQMPSSQSEDSAPELHRAYLSGFDGRVYPTRVEINDHLLLCRRGTSESGRLNIAWPVKGFGHPVLQTSSLMERNDTYLLVLELARGKICAVRDQVSAWQLAGMALPEELSELSHEAHRLFSRAASNQSDLALAQGLAQQALEKACQAADVVTRSYARQRMQVRRRRGASLPTVLGCGAGAAMPKSPWREQFSEAFTAALVPVQWNLIEPQEGEYNWDVCDCQVEWCREQKLMAFGGPLIDFGPNGLPAWLQKWEHDFFNMQSFLSDFVETAVGRYIGYIRHWEVVARGNTGVGAALTEEHRLMLAARVLEAAQQVDEEVSLMIRVDQPWGEYMARGQHQLSPMQFIDALLRSGVGLSAVNLEFAVGYRPRGSGSRDLLDFSRLLDQWSSLGLPLNVMLACPSSSEADPMADPDLDVASVGMNDVWSEDLQAEWVDRYVPVLLSKQSVAGVFWSHFQDGVPHSFPNAGLVRSDESAKPSFVRIAQFRSEYWKSDDKAN